MAVFYKPFLLACSIILCMEIALDKLPDDIEELKSLVANQLVRNEKLSSEHQGYKAQVPTLKQGSRSAAFDYFYIAMLSYGQLIQLKQLGLNQTTRPQQVQGQRYPLQPMHQDLDRWN